MPHARSSPWWDRLARVRQPSLVKLAISYGLKARRHSIHLLSTDDYRIGGPEQLRLYAAILGVGFQACRDPLSLWRKPSRSNGAPT